MSSAATSAASSDSALPSFACHACASPVVGKKFYQGIRLSVLCENCVGDSSLVYKTTALSLLGGGVAAQTRLSRLDYRSTRNRHNRYADAYLYIRAECQELGHEVTEERSRKRKALKEQRIVDLHKKGNVKLKLIPFPGLGCDADADAGVMIMDVDASEWDATADSDSKEVLTRRRAVRKPQRKKRKVAAEFSIQESCERLNETPHLSELVYGDFWTSQRKNPLTSAAAVKKNLTLVEYTRFACFADLPPAGNPHVYDHIQAYFQLHNMDIPSRETVFTRACEWVLGPDRPKVKLSEADSMLAKFASFVTLSHSIRHLPSVTFRLRSFLTVQDFVSFATASPTSVLPTTAYAMGRDTLRFAVLGAAVAQPDSAAASTSSQPESPHTDMIRLHVLRWIKFRNANLDSLKKAQLCEVLEQLGCTDLSGKKAELVARVEQVADETMTVYGDAVVSSDASSLGDMTDAEQWRTVEMELLNRQSSGYELAQQTLRTIRDILVQVRIDNRGSRKVELVERLTSHLDAFAREIELKSSDGTESDDADASSTSAASSSYYDQPSWVITKLRQNLPARTSTSPRLNAKRILTYALRYVASHANTFDAAGINNALDMYVQSTVGQIGARLAIGDPFSTLLLPWLQHYDRASATSAFPELRHHELVEDSKRQKRKYEGRQQLEALLPEELRELYFKSFRFQQRRGAFLRNCEGGRTTVTAAAATEAKLMIEWHASGQSTHLPGVRAEYRAAAPQRLHRTVHSSHPAQQQPQCSGPACINPGAKACSQQRCRRHCNDGACRRHRRRR
jgi:hypothetical protein